MTPAFALIIAAMGLIFIAWSFMMFRTLFAMRRRVAARTGKPFPGVFDSMSEWKRWFTDAATRTERRILIGLTLALLICIALLATLAPR